MGAITRAAANNFTTGGVILPAAINDASVASITSLSQVAAGDNMTLISSATASGDSSITFTSGLDSTYKTYCFKIVNMHPSADNLEFQFSGSTNGGSSYDENSITSNVYDAQHIETGASGIFNYQTSQDEAGTGVDQLMFTSVGNDNDQSGCSEFWLFEPSSTTYHKHFFCWNNRQNANEYTIESQVGGYFRTSSAINAIRFRFSGGNIDSGSIYLYGIG
jgi:hypothetical protein